MHHHIRVKSTQGTSQPQTLLLLLLLLLFCSPPAVAAGSASLHLSAEVHARCTAGGGTAQQAQPGTLQVSCHILFAACHTFFAACHTFFAA
jgi:hypothetical protein